MGAKDMPTCCQGSTSRLFYQLIHCEMREFDELGLIVRLINECTKVFWERPLATIIGELPIDNAIAFLADKAIDTFD
ncbi:Na(+)/H(+) antiporter subunit B [Pseudomonas sp. S31]|nr:Na(+)/H(+) antiporter subunit B [Pseudomonas sp. S31]